MYRRNRYPVPRPAPAFTSKKPAFEEEKVQALSVPAPNVPEENEIDISDKRGMIPAKAEPVGDKRVVDNNKYLFRFFNIKFWLDDIIILALIILILGEKRQDEFLLPILTYLFFGGKEF